jgi:hypothetical protein
MERKGKHPVDERTGKEGVSGRVRRVNRTDAKRTTEGLHIDFLFIELSVVMLGNQYIK